MEKNNVMCIYRMNEVYENHFSRRADWETSSEPKVYGNHFSRRADRETSSKPKTDFVIRKKQEERKNWECLIDTYIF